jgi:cysteine desulfurase
LREVYLDYAATTPVHPDVAAAVLEVLREDWGNPSSIHGRGRRARRCVEAARTRVAELIGAEPDEVVFTSGGTEADNLAVLGAARAAREEGRGAHVVTSAVEHHAVLDACGALAAEGFEVSVLPVDRAGRVDPAAAEDAIRDDTVLVSVMLANNELGTIQPVGAIARAAHARGALVHTDAVQAAGQIPVDVRALGVDLLTLSAHKIYGPKGVGALFVRRGVRLAPLVHGGSQERRWRPGTENVPGIVGFGVAAELARRECTSGAVEPSHVLLAAGYPREVALTAVRFSVGTPTTEEDVDGAVERLAEALRRQGAPAGR